MIERRDLIRLYAKESLSMMDIANRLGCSQHKVAYWMDKYKIKRRNISDAIYARANPTGDPFAIKNVHSPEDARLLGLGLGIYWGEGNKKNNHAVRVGNTDPQLIKTFVKFLQDICGVKSEKIRYGLQLFSDADEKEAVAYWLGELLISREQLMPTVSRIDSGKIGTYKTKNRYGVLTVYVFNKKLRDWMVGQLGMPL